MRKLLMLPITLYRAAISPLKPSCCRYIPTCSHYALQAIDRHGPMRGGWLAARRILRCHPLGGSGLDEVPPLPITQKDLPDATGK